MRKTEDLPSTQLADLSSDAIRLIRTSDARTEVENKNKD